MTQITGKIYQMTNGKTGTNLENRFPRTVMEAVLGLNSYLQDQFSALADIYMPIEGISEAFTGQEFVYRKSPNTIKAKSLTLDRIKGKTLAWNQLVQTSGDQSQTINGVEITDNLDGSFTFNGTASAQISITLTTVGVKYYAGHKYLLKGCPTGGGQDKYRMWFNTGYLPDFGEGVIQTIHLSGSAYIAVRIASGQSFTNAKFVPNCFDLTLTFGAGYEPATVAEFEALYPDAYYPYNPGTLISNDAEAVETTGVNQWDEEWELGTLNTTTGEKVANATMIRSKNYISVLPSTNYYVKGNLVVCFYDAEGTYIGFERDAHDTIITTPDGCSKILFRASTDYGTTYNHDICINLSNPAINGQYFPYWKRTLNLGLNNIKVKSHNIWDEEWESGYIDVTSGNLVGSTSYRRSKNAIKVFQSTAYYLKGTNFRLYFYDANGGYISYLASQTNTIFSTPANAYLMRFYSENANIEVGAVCINISSSFNGQYEPYGDITINGLKSAGSVYDEIVGNKDIKRVGSVDLGSLEWTPGSVAGLFLASITGQKIVVTNTKPNCICSKYIVGTTIASSANAEDKTIYQGNSNNYIYFKDTAFRGYTGEQVAEALSGVMLYYELATPIEYDLVEPLIYTTKTGTTEERISPNSDGLSAPFCCDMIYSANENNDAGNAQYAATAGRLLNTRKIWGQDFNGSEDVDGNLVSNGILQGTQLKSTVPTGTAPLVVSSTTTVANLVAEKASKLLTARTIWGRSFDGSDNISGALEGVTTISASGLATLNGGMTIPSSANAKHGTLDFIDGDAVKHIVVVSREEDIPASPDLYTLYVVATTTV